MKVNPVYRVVHFLTRLFFRLYGRWQIIGYDKLPKTGSVIAACNHVSYLDPEIIGSAICRECAFIARHDLWNKKWLAWLLTEHGIPTVAKEDEALNGLNTKDTKGRKNEPQDESAVETAPKKYTKCSSEH